MWPEAGSFRDDGMGPAPPGWRGICQDQQASDDAQVRCNRSVSLTPPPHARCIALLRSHRITHTTCRPWRCGAQLCSVCCAASGGSRPPCAPLTCVWLDATQSSKQTSTPLSLWRLLLCSSCFLSPCGLAIYDSVSRPSFFLSLIRVW